MAGPSPFYCLLALLSFSASAQLPKPLSGRIRRYQSSEVLAGVTVINRTKATTNRSDLGGNYRIVARPGDTLLFSSAGYLSDTTPVVAWMLEEKNGYDIYLRPNVVRLPSVLIDQNSNYQKDSLQRRDDYAWIYMMHQDHMVSDTNFSQGFGLSFDLNFFNKHQKEKRRLRRRLAQEEKDYYVDFRCPPAWVEKVTGLHGDSLRIFLLQYRPGYDFCRKASNEDIFLYINDKVKKFRRVNLSPPGKKKFAAARLPLGSIPAFPPVYSPSPDLVAKRRITHIGRLSIVGSVFLLSATRSAPTRV